MPKLRRVALAGALIQALLLAAIAAPAAATPAAGKVRFVQAAESDFDVYTKNPTPAQQAWMGARYWRMRAYAPYFDSRLSWFRNAWFYKNLYAIYTHDDLADEHPDWILKDGQGRRLYIPFGCSGGACPQYAADVGNPAFRAHWIEQARERLAAGYRGIFIDDVNMELRVGDGSGRAVAPIDPRTGSPMSLSTWRRYVAEFTEAIRAAFPDAEIVHNAIWFSGYTDPYVQRELRAADLVELERGVNDGGITGGGGRFGYESFIERIDWLHSQGKGVILDGRPGSDIEREYSLATYFLTATALDGIGDSIGGRPDSWWPGYGVDLGAPSGPRYSWQGLLRRDFAAGTVLVNQPGEPTRTVAVGNGLRNVRGTPRASVTLQGAQGAVLLGTAARGAPPGHDPSRSQERAATRTRVVPRAHPKRATAVGSMHGRRVLAVRRSRGGGRARPRRLRHAVLVRGVVRQATGSRVVVRVHRRTRHRWVRARAVRTRLGANGRFRRLVRGLPSGRYRVHAYYLGSRASTPSRSPHRRFQIRR